MSPDADVQMQFEDATRQREAATLGMWVFLATEVMFFAALLGSYALYRSYFPLGFIEGSRALSQVLGAIETADLITASLFAVLALYAIETDHRGWAAALFLLTALLGVVFLVMHGTEYAEHIREHDLPGRLFADPRIDAAGGAEFFTCYWFLTVLHSFHVLCGVVVLTWMAWRTARGRFGPTYYTPLELTALYWHFVDLVWVFLFPMFYLVR